MSEKPVKVVSISEPDQQIVTNRILADHLGLTDKRVIELAAEGVVVQISRNKYDLLASSKGYIRYLQERSRSTAAIDGDYNAWRAEKEKYAALLAQQDYTQKQGEMLTKSDVQTAIGYAVVSGRRIIESAGGRLKTQFPDMTNDQIAEVNKFLVKMQNELARIEF